MKRSKKKKSNYLGTHGEEAQKKPFARIFLFLEQFSPQASLNSKESILSSALYCIVLC